MAHSNTDERTLIDLLQQAEPWTAYPTYSEEGWHSLMVLAHRVQGTESEVVRDAFTTFEAEAERNTLEAWGKLFLLLRVVFNLASPLRPGVRIGQFTCWVKLRKMRGGGDEWPIDWSGDTPKLLSGCQGWIGPPYDFVSEYEFLRSSYAERQLCIGGFVGR